MWQTDVSRGIRTAVALVIGLSKSHEEGASHESTLACRNLLWGHYTSLFLIGKEQHTTTADRWRGNRWDSP
jgi:hypothetical protein